MSLTTILGSHTLAESRPFLNDNFSTLAGLSYGATAPSPTYPYMFWADTASQTLKQRTAADDAWLVLGQLGQSFLGLLPLAGGTMLGDIDMNDNSIEGLPAPASATSPARKQELDLKADLAAPALTGDATVNQDPVGNNSLIRRSWATAQFMARTGGTFTGAVAGVTSADAAAFLPRSVIEALTSFHPTTGHRHTGTDARKVQFGDLEGAAIGIVNADGTKSRGTGFTSVKAAAGTYTITWSATLSAVPIVLVTPVSTAIASAHVANVTTAGCTVYTEQNYLISGEWTLVVLDLPFHIAAIV